MAKTSYIDIPSGLEESFNKGLKSGDRFLYSKIIRNDTLLSKQKKRKLANRSFFSYCSVFWRSFTTIQKEAWHLAADETNLNGWTLFIQDQIARYHQGLPATATPSLLHQSWVGEIKITSPATEIKIVQFHPHNYWVEQKVVGKKGMYKPVEVTENFGIPLQIGLNYKSNLTAVGPNPYAKFYALIKNSYQAVDDETELKIDLDLIHDWQIVTETLSSLRGTIIGYTLFIELHDLQGELYFDKVQAIHNGQNWVRDPYCKDIAKTFTKAFQQIPQNWAPLILPVGAEYDTIYKDF